MLVVELATAADYGLTVDEFNADDYGPKALAWYTSGFQDRSHFETVEFSLWYYGPWFHMLTAFEIRLAQQFGSVRAQSRRQAARGELRCRSQRPVGRLARRQMSAFGGQTGH
jgi:hypothetical protein